MPGEPGEIWFAWISEPHRRGASAVPVTRGTAVVTHHPRSRVHQYNLAMEAIG